MGTSTDRDKRERYFLIKALEERNIDLIDLFFKDFVLIDKPEVKARLILDFMKHAYPKITNINVDTGKTQKTLEFNYPNPLANVKHTVTKILKDEGTIEE